MFDENTNKMHKVFINDKPLIFSYEKVKAEKSVLFENASDFDQAIAFLNDKTTSINIYHPEIKSVWKEFKNEFKKIYAAGGVVLNEANQMLWIYRLGKWDLPKGKMEKNEKKKETAIREVEEECGIENLKITQKLSTTYHMYYHKKWILKITYWYEMQHTGHAKLVPQEEEGITKVEWINQSDLPIVMNKTYHNILDLIQKYY